MRRPCRRPRAEVDAPLLGRDGPGGLEAGESLEGLEVLGAEGDAEDRRRKDPRRPYRRRKPPPPPPPPRPPPHPPPPMAACSAAGHRRPRGPRRQRPLDTFVAVLSDDHFVCTTACLGSGGLAPSHDGPWPGPSPSCSGAGWCRTCAEQAVAGRQVQTGAMAKSPFKPTTRGFLYSRTAKVSRVHAPQRSPVLSHSRAVTETKTVSASNFLPT
jgi:hypothetical protein